MRKSSEFTHNFIPNRKSMDKFSCGPKLSVLNNKGRNSFMNSLKHLKAKKDLERKKTNYYSNAKLNIITILSNCINENFYNELSFHGIASESKNSSIKSKIKKKRKSRRSTMKKGHSFIKHLESDKINSDKFKQTISLDDLSPNNSKKDKSISMSCDKDSSEKKSNKFSSNSINNKKIFVLSNKQLTHIKKNYTQNENTFISNNKHKRATFIHSKRDSIIKNLSEIEKRKIDQNIFNDINLLHLKKKIAQVKKILKHKYNASSEKNSYKKIITLQPINNNSSISDNGISNQKSSNSLNLIKSDNLNKFRRIIRKANLFDSLDDEEYSDQETGYYISPNSLFIKFHDFLLLFSSLFYLIIIPYFLSQNYFFLQDNNLLIIILLFIDLIYIIDVIINCFRAYKNFDETIIKKAKKIFSHYFRGWLFVDLIQAFPFFSLLYFLKQRYNLSCSILHILFMLKAIKIFTIQENNTLINYLSDLLSISEVIDDNKSNLMILFIFSSFLNIATCLYIFLGINSYPSWIIKLNIQDDNYVNIYITSLYFVIVTITTVGYGDITGNTIPEVLFQMVLLILGTIVYSFIISYFSNYIVKISQKSINFKNKLEILNEIKVHHPKMSNAIYKEVLRNLKNEQFYEKKDKQVLFQNLPYYLKNILIMEMYKPIITNFIFFKDIDNSDFIVKIATSLKPLISIKGDILIQEGDYIKEILFVKQGVLGLNISINLKNPEHSIQKYHELIDFEREVSHIKTSFLKSNNKKLLNTTNTTNTTFLSIKEEESTFSEDYDNADVKDINIIKIRAKEHFGDALMFLNEKCPLKIKIITKKAELLILKKMEAIEIYSIYPHIWEKINKKSLYNMEQIYLKIERTLNILFIRYRKTTNKSAFSKEYKIVINKPQDIEENLNKNNIHNYSKKSEIKNTRLENEKQLETQMSNTVPHNITFSEMNNTIKEDTLQYEEPVKTGKKKTLFQKVNNNKNENHLNETTKKNSKENNISELKTLKMNTKDTFENNDNSNIYNNNIIINYQKQLLVFNNDFSENSIKKNNSNIEINKKSLSSNELIPKNKRMLNKFLNLTSTKENSIHLNSSYENINKISNYNYIKNINLQNRIKQVIDDECTKYLVSPTNKNSISNLNNNKAGKPFLIKGNYRRDKSYRSSIEYSLNDNNELFRKLNSFHPTKNMPKEFDSYMTSRSDNESESVLSNRLNNHHIINSQRNSPIRNKKNMIQKKAFIGKRLNTISKNIKNANDVINNPNEFYMNFFNNIIQKQTNNQMDGDNIKNKKANQFLSGFNPSTDNTKKYQRNNQIEPKLFESKPTIKKEG